MGLSSLSYGNTRAGKLFDFSCPNNSYIVGFSGRASAWMDAIAANCSDGSTLGPLGGSGGVAQWSETCQSGFSGIQVWWDSQHIISIKVICNGIEKGIVGWSGGSSQAFTCPRQVLSRIRGTASQYVYSLQFSCSGKHQFPMFSELQQAITLQD